MRGLNSRVTRPPQKIGTPLAYGFPVVRLYCPGSPKEPSSLHSKGRSGLGEEPDGVLRKRNLQTSTQTIRYMGSQRDRPFSFLLFNMHRSHHADLRLTLRGPPTALRNTTYEYSIHRMICTIRTIPSAYRDAGFTPKHAAPVAFWSLNIVPREGLDMTTLDGFMFPDLVYHCPELVHTYIITRSPSSSLEELVIDNQYLVALSRFA
ncbi:hypothetical protein SODALDRAFT_377105 [Sodiomyces alkalinus F11]|uniref:Uncharacterized protein n=1 Tax=Sodiomyces alkalinus (strain CBS 110278 / VKM F-3762 / F11) TaxID=1314773 RepID=A0A3N2Q3V2_SODAK|nr:hypothetical protein SODALDRAFT_377105 [Sodiomyces alkalinus F11]ROT41432.1 hypothetical protein SODALDRAFT_377105 [Sodiomyces alkalinus F11]